MAQRSKSQLQWDLDQATWALQRVLDALDAAGILEEGFASNIANAAVTAIEENAQLRDWKRQASSVLSEWDQVHDALGRPGALGQSVPEACRAEVDRLRAQVDELVPWAVAGGVAAAHGGDLVDLIEPDPSVTPEEFEQQLDEIQARGYNLYSRARFAGEFGAQHAFDHETFRPVPGVLDAPGRIDAGEFGEVA